MEQNHAPSNEAAPVSVTTQDEMDRVVDRITDGLVDAWEDALADVDHYLRIYDRPNLVSAMQLAILINNQIEFLKQYHSSRLTPDEGD